MIVVAVEQDVGQNRNRVLPLDDALKEREFFQQIAFADDKLHGQDDLTDCPIRQRVRITVWERRPIFTQ